MSIAEAFLAELEHEAGLTRKILERIPDDKLEYKPHEKSMALGRLAGHIAEIPQWGVSILSQDVFDLNPDEHIPGVAKSGKEVVQTFDQGLAAMKDALKGKSDSQMLATWKMTVKGQPVMEMARVAVFRSMVMNHTVHHRAQLGVYLRMNGLPVPATYGPSADEQPG